MWQSNRLILTCFIFRADIIAPAADTMHKTELTEKVAKSFLRKRRQANEESREDHEEEDEEEEDEWHLGDVRGRLRKSL